MLTTGELERHLIKVSKKVVVLYYRQENQSYNLTEHARLLCVTWNIYVKVNFNMTD